MMTSVEDIYACGDCVETVDAITGESALYLLKHNAIEQAEVVARNCPGDTCTYAGAWSFARVHYFDTHAVSTGQSSKALGESASIELIERTFGDDYSRLILKEGKLAGAQAIGKFANYAGVLLGAMWQQEDLCELRSSRDKVLQINHATPPATSHNWSANGTQHSGFCRRGQMNIRKFIQKLEFDKER